MSAQNSDLYEHVPPNRSNSGRIGPLRSRNLVEAILFTIPVVLIILLIPFVDEVKIKLIIIVAVPLLIAAIVGIRNRSFTEAYIRWLKHRKRKRSLKLRSVADGIKANRVTEGTNAIEKAKELFFTESISADGKESGFRERAVHTIKSVADKIKESL